MLARTLSQGSVQHPCTSLGGRPLPHARPHSICQSNRKVVHRQSFSLHPVLRGGSSICRAATSPTVTPEWGDIVEYVLPKPIGAATLGIGRVEEVSQEHVTLVPLEEEDDVWVEPHEAQAVAVAPEALLRVMESDLSQRQDRESNPHGEHAHDVYRLLAPPSGAVYRGPLAVKVVLREGS